VYTLEALGLLLHTYVVLRAPLGCKLLMLHVLNCVLLDVQQASGMEAHAGHGGTHACTSSIG
jgi:hypothetical protein